MSCRRSEQSGPALDCPFSFSFTWLALSSTVTECRKVQVYVSASSVQAPVSVIQGLPQLLNRGKTISKSALRLTHKPLRSGIWVSG